jgi:hypothetical protein
MPPSVALDEALKAADMGYAVMPICRPLPDANRRGCKDHGRSCAGQNGKSGTAGKKPLFTTNVATCSQEQIKAWWRCGDYNVGVKTLESGLLMVDYDVDLKKPQGKAWIETHEKAGRHLVTRTHRTGTDGRHWAYKRPDGLYHGDRIVKGLDLRGAGNHHYVVWTGSRHASGRLYEVVVESPVLDLPEWIAEEIARAARVEREDLFTPAGETVLEKLWVRAGLPIYEAVIRPTRVLSWVPCLLEHEHTTSKKRLDCVLIAGKGVGAYGKYKCAHGSHAITTYQAVQMLRERLGEDVFNEVTAEYKHVRRIERAYENSLDECSTELDAIFAGIDEQRGRIVVAEITTGLGKSHAARQYLASHGDRPTSAFYPNHALAGEQAERLADDYGVNAAHPKGVGSFKETPCVFPGMAQAAAELKVPLRQSVCRSCPHRNNYQGLGMACTAGSASTQMDGRHRLLQHATLDAVLRDEAAAVTRGDKQPSVVIVDEQPALVDAVAVDVVLLSDPKTFDLYGLDSGTKNAYVRLAGYLAMASKVYTKPQQLVYATARDVIAVGTSKRGQERFPFADTSDALTKEIADRALPSPVEAGAKLAQKVTSGLYDDAELNLTRLARTHTLLYALQRACTFPHRETFQFSEDKIVVRVPAAWLVEATAYARAGGTTLVMSASADSSAITRAAGELVEVKRVHARDAPNVERRFRFDRNVSRRWLLKDGKVREGVLRDAMMRVADEVKGLREVLIVTHKPVAEALRGRRGDFLPETWEGACRAGAGFHVAHYGACVGLDLWRDVEAVVTVGDPIPNLDDARAQARALGADPAEHLNHLVQSELLQAHGRGRACRRTSGLLIVHFGIYTPDVQLAPQWTKFVLPRIALEKP